MLEKLWRNRNTVVTLCFIFIAVLLFVMPPEARLGNKIKLVYFHASIAENSIIFFVLSGIFALISLLTGKEKSYKRASSFFYVGFYLWVFQTILGAFNMKIIWGNFFWSEPKAKMGLVLLAVSLLVYLFVEFKPDLKKISSVLFIFMAGAALYGLFLTSNVFHPKNAIFGSDILAYKIIFVAMVVLWFGINYLWSEKLYRVNA